MGVHPTTTKSAFLLLPGPCQHTPTSPPAGSHSKHLPSTAAPPFPSQDTAQSIAAAIYLWLHREASSLLPCLLHLLLLLYFSS